MVSQAAGLVGVREVLSGKIALNNNDGPGDFPILLVITPKRRRVAALQKSRAPLFVAAIGDLVALIGTEEFVLPSDSRLTTLDSRLTTHDLLGG